LDANTAVGPLRFGALRHVGLDGAVLEHRLDHQVAALQQREVGAGGDLRQQRVALLGRAAALLHRLVQQALRIGLARSAASCVVSSSTTSMPALADT
jgi:hypothetical protein